LSLLPQFIDYRAAGVFRQSLTLGGTLIIAFACANATVAASVGGVAKFLTTRPKWLVVQRCTAQNNC